MAKEKKTIEDRQKEIAARSAANEARANSVWAPEEITEEVVEAAGDELLDDEKPKAEEIAIGNMTDEDLVAARDSASKEERSKYQDEINKRNSDGKEHFWQAADKELADKREAEAQARAEAEAEEDDGKPETFDQDQAKNAVSEDNQLAAMEEFKDETGIDPTVDNVDEAVLRSNNYTKKYGGVEIRKVTHPDGSISYEATPKPLSFLKYSKNEKGLGATIALAALTISSVAATLVTASIADPAVPIIPPINFSAFDPNLVGYKAYKSAVIGLASDINTQNAEAWGEAAKAKTNIGNEGDIKTGAKLEGETNLAKQEPTMEKGQELKVETMEKSQELQKDMDLFRQNLEKEMAKYKNDLFIALKNVDADIQKQIITYMTNNEIDKAKKMASEVGADKTVLDNLDKAIKASSGNLHMNAQQMNQVVQGWVNTGLNAVGTASGMLGK